MHVADDLYLGNGQTLGSIMATAQGGLDPTLQQGAGPLGRIFFHNVIPLTKATNNIATTQHTTAATALVLTAGTGITTGLAPDGSGRTVYVLDTPRCLALTSSADMHLVSLAILGFDLYGQPMTQTKALGSSATTVNTTKAFKSVLSITSSATDGTNNVTIGTADIFGLPIACADAGYIMPKWAETLAIDAGTFAAADTTSPATATTGDVRGTYAPSSASDGTKRLVAWLHVTGNACGPNAILASLLGVPQV